MEINEKSIRIRSFNEKDLAWHKYIDWEKQDLTVPCFFNGTDSMVYSEFLMAIAGSSAFSKVM